MRSVNLKKVILTCNIGSLGKIGDIVGVKPGYAKNYLVPKRFAFYATKVNIENFEKNKDQVAKKGLNDREVAIKIQAILNNKVFSFICNASDDGRLYGSVSMKNISSAINSYISDCGLSGLAIESSNIKVDNNGVKFLGEHIVKVAIYDDITVKVSVFACRSESDIESFIAKKESEKHSA